MSIYSITVACYIHFLSHFRVSLSTAKGKYITLLYVYLAHAFDWLLNMFLGSVECVEPVSSRLQHSVTLPRFYLVSLILTGQPVFNATITLVLHFMLSSWCMFGNVVKIKPVGRW